MVGKVEQIDTDDTLSLGTGMVAVPPTDSDLFVPLHVVPGTPREELSPTPDGYVTFKYMSPIGLCVSHVQWKTGMDVATAFRIARQQDPIFRLLRMPAAKYVRKIDEKRVRLSHRLRTGDVVSLMPGAAR